MILLIGFGVVGIVSIIGVIWVGEIHHGKNAKIRRIKQLKKHIAVLDDYLKYRGAIDKNYIITLDAKKHLEMNLKEIEHPPFWFWW